MNFNPLITYSSIFVLVFLSFLGSYNIIIQSAAGQMNMDSFSAQGIIFSKLTSSPLLNDQNFNQTESITTLLNDSTQTDTSGKSLPSLQGQWAFDVKKGEVDLFRAIFTLVQNNKILNAFGIFNLKDTKYIQLNDKGTEIISGTVDLTSHGLKNETLSNIPATITITGLTQLRISLDETITEQLLTDPIIGSTRFLADASGNILIGPRPPPPNSPPSNSFYDPNIF
jgi:hypothetical protein